MPDSTELKSPPRRGRAANAAPRRSGQTMVRVYNSLRDQILDGVIPQGAHISIQSIATATDSSNGPVISALARLANEGLVLHQRGQGYRVAEWTPEMLDDLLVIRRALECEAARLAAVNAGPGDIARLQALVDEMAEIVREGRRADGQIADVEMHIAIAQLSRSPSLIDALRRSHLLEIVHRRLQIYEPRGDFTNLATNHQLLVNEIASGDPNRAYAEMHEHLAGRTAAARTTE
ncbi:MAG: GntR family transcriptional regulator [Planctomycetaceae bacterium]|nr:GntR family transcriptional regulator [Planctomycetaceae bacterium]